MKHNLDEINAAIRLGDRPVPPVGSYIQMLTPGKWWKVMDYEDETQTLLLVEKRCRMAGWWPLKQFSLLFSIPPTAPPFSSWKRL